MLYIHFFSNDFILTLNSSVRKRLSLVHAFSEILVTCSAQLQVLEKVRPKCLWLFVSFAQTYPFYSIVNLYIFLWL